MRILKDWQVLAPATILAAVGFAQERPSFEVASIRPAAGTPFRGSPVGPGTADPEHYATRNTPVKSLIMTAYSLENYQVLGPASIDARWDVLANVARGATREQVNLMLQSLLEDRFHLKLHGRPSVRGRAVPADFLVLAWNESPDHILAGVNARMAGLARALRSMLGGTLVIDKTGLTGSYDLRMEFARPDLSAQDDAPLPSMFTALEQQLGLKLEPIKTTDN